MIPLKDPIRVEGERIMLIPVDMRYLDDIYKGFSSEITQYMVPKAAKSTLETEQFIHKAQARRARKQEIVFVILEKASQQFLGCCGLQGLQGLQPELGIWIKKQAHGQGYGMESIFLLLNWAKAHYRAFTYPVDSRNIPSIKIPERFGASIKRRYKRINEAGFQLDIHEYWIESEKIPDHLLSLYPGESNNASA